MRLLPVKFSTWQCRALISCYELHPETPSVELLDASDGSPIAKATIWVAGLLPSEVAIKSYSENHGMEVSLMNAGIIGPRLREIELGPDVSVTVHRLTSQPQADYDEVRAEYDLTHVEENKE